MGGFGEFNRPAQADKLAAGHHAISASKGTTMTSIRKAVRIAAKPGHSIEARAALAELQQATRAEPGCREFVFFQALTEPERFLLLEDFADAGALDAHMSAPHTKAFFARALLAGIDPIQPGSLS
jgi:quinol monooxygenase YgiN